jgi:lipopolysaccharide export system permease protein
MRRTIAATYADLLSTVIEEKAFRRIDDGLYVQISERVKGRILKGLFVADSRDPHYDMLYYAREGAVDEKGGTLLMKDGEIHRKAPGGNVSIVHFDSYSFDLSDLSEARGQAKLRASDRGLGFLFHPDPKDPDVKEKPFDYRAELHRRLTDWFFPVIFALASLALAGGAHSHRDRTVHPLIPALVFAFAFRWSAFFLANRIESPSGSPAPLYGFIIAVTLLLIYAVYRNSKYLRKHRPLTAVVEGMTRTTSRLLPRPSNAGASE